MRSSGWTWVAAAWTPGFTGFLHRFMAAAAGSAHAPDGPELYAGDVITAAIEAGLAVGAVRYPDGRSHDLGTWSELAEFWLDRAVEDA